MKVIYGTKYVNVDVTDICKSRLFFNNIITIPSGDLNRSIYFTDPIHGVLKTIFITMDDHTTEYDDSLMININQQDQSITTIDVNKYIGIIHSKLNLKYGSFTEELPEQKMVVRYLTGNEKVLEIGGNIGRNSLVIAQILKNSNNNNFVSLESDISISNQLVENRDLNNFDFHVESSALSKRFLIQKGWDTIESYTLLDGYTEVNIISYEELKYKYDIEFDTLVLDCEGAFYYITMDMPEILKNINMIIMENDYYDFSHKEYIDKVLKDNNFSVVYVEQGGWGPCYDRFFEVWKKDLSKNVV